MRTTSLGNETFMSHRCHQNMATAQISYAQVLLINYYKKDKLLMQENKWEQNKSKTHHFLQTHGHIICYYGRKKSYKGSGTTFSICTPTIK